MSEIPPPPGGGTYTPPPPSPRPAGPTSAGSGGGDRTIMLVLSYLGPLALIPLFMKKDDREVQWHAKNGLVITVAEIILGVLLGIVSQVPILGCAAALIWCVFPLLCLVVSIIGIVKALNGQRLVIPGVSDFADKINM